MHLIGFDHLASWFWNEQFWLPPNRTWDDMADTSQGIQRSNSSDLYYPLYFAWVILLLKFIFEKHVFRRIGQAWGLKNVTRRMPATNPTLEEVFQSGKTPKDNHMKLLSSQLQMPERNIERWLRQRSLCRRPTKLDKFSESCWRALFYGSISLYSWLVLWNKTWFWHITDCWHRYPDHSVPFDIWCYYMIELSFYWSLFISQFYDAKRKDFWEMFAHHIATIALLCFSWICNLFKVGSLVLWVHDIADVFLEIAKVFIYLGKSNVADSIFYAFAVCWVVTRLGYFPTWIIFSITVEAPQFIQYFPAYYVFSLLLSLLLVLNLFWFYFLAKMGYLSYFMGKMGKDVRSDDEDEDEDL